MPERILAELKVLNENLTNVQIFWTRFFGVLVVCVLGVVFAIREIDRDNELQAACERGNESRLAVNETVSAIKATDAVLDFILTYFDQQATSPQTQDAVDRAVLLLEDAKEFADNGVQEVREC
jgi:hypothetical protein